MEFLLNCLCFNDRFTKDKRRAESKLAPISTLWSMLMTNFSENYSPGSYMTIDKQLVRFQGQCLFRVYMPNQPNKYGLKIFRMVDNSTKYMVSAIIYQGKGSTYADVPQAKYIVLQLVDSIKGTKRNATCDNWSTSIKLAGNS